GPIQDQPRRGILVELIQRCPINGKRFEEIRSQAEGGLREASGLSVFLLLEISETEIVVYLRRFGIKPPRFLKGLNCIIERAEFAEQHPQGYQFIDIIGAESRPALIPGLVRVSCRESLPAAREFLL